MAVLVENRHAAQFAAVPFRLIFMEFRVDRFEERSHKRDLERRTNNGAFQPDVLDYAIDVGC